MGLGGYLDRSRKWKKAPHLGWAGAGQPTRPMDYTTRRLYGSTSLDGDVNYLASRKPERMATKNVRPEAHVVYRFV